MLYGGLQHRSCRVGCIGPPELVPPASRAHTQPGGKGYTDTHLAASIAYAVTGAQICLQMQGLPCIGRKKYLEIESKDGNGCIPRCRPHVVVYHHTTPSRCAHRYTTIQPPYSSTTGMQLCSYTTALQYITLYNPPQPLLPHICADGVVIVCPTGRDQPYCCRAGVARTAPFPLSLTATDVR